jgi:phage gpG-like protein
MKPEEFIKQLERQSEEFKKWFNNTLPNEIGNTAVEFYKEAFHDAGAERDRGGFTDKTFEPWKEVKRRENPRTNRTSDKSPILVQTANLKRSIQYTAEPEQVTIFSDAEYAATHNEGTTTAGRNHNITIPKRQFIGKSATLDKKIEEIMKEGVDRILEK